MGIIKRVDLSRTDFVIINDYARKTGLSFSEALSKTSIAYILHQQEKDRANKSVSSHKISDENQNH